MKTQDIIPACGNALSYVFTAIQSNEVFQIVSFIISILTSLIIIVYKIWAWYREAKRDGKITKDEIIDLCNRIGDDVDDLRDKTKDGK